VHETALELCDLAVTGPMSGPGSRTPNFEVEVRVRLLGLVRGWRNEGLGLTIGLVVVEGRKGLSTKVVAPVLSHANRSHYLTESFEPNRQRDKSNLQPSLRNLLVPLVPRRRYASRQEQDARSRDARYIVALGTVRTLSCNQ
jgi:hypothetical protein